MRNIIIVEGFSTGKNYIQDIIDRNYNPIVLETKPEPDSDISRRFAKERQRGYESIIHDFEIIYEKDSYEETVEMVRGYDPLVIIPGAERGVILANKLAYDLDLFPNPIESIDAMTLKDKMHERLAENNMRSIRGRVISSVEEAIDFYDEECLKKVVVKPLYSAGSVGVRLCEDKSDMIRSIEEVFTQRGVYGNVLNELLIQEQIEGQEYIVNTVSCDGVHRLTSILKYKKIKTSEGGNIYDYGEVVPELDIGESTLVEYAYDTADALGVKYGMIHGEYMLDEKGPVLIEVNCRPMGASFDAEFLDSIFGHHETDCVLDAYLNPDKFDLDRKKGYRTFAYGILKSFIVPEDLIARSSAIGKIGINLKSHYKTTMNFGNEFNLVTKTQDFHTLGGTVYLVNDDYKQIRYDLEFLRKLERRAFGLVLSEDKHQTIDIDENKVAQDIKILVENIKPYGNILLVTEQTYNDLDAFQVNLDSMDEVTGKFNCVVVNLNESICNISSEEVSKIFLKIFDKVRLGGAIFIPKTTYEYLPNGRMGMEALLKLLDFKLEIPVHQLNRMVIASKTLD